MKWQNYGDGEGTLYKKQTGKEEREGPNKEVTLGAPLPPPTTLRSLGNKLSIKPPSVLIAATFSSPKSFSPFSNIVPFGFMKTKRELPFYPLCDRDTIYFA